GSRLTLTTTRSLSGPRTPPAPEPRHDWENPPRWYATVPPGGVLRLLSGFPRACVPSYQGASTNNPNPEETHVRDDQAQGPVRCPGAALVHRNRGGVSGAQRPGADTASAGQEDARPRRHRHDPQPDEEDGAHRPLPGHHLHRRAGREQGAARQGSPARR